MSLPRLLILTDRSQLSLGRSLVRTVAECVEAGATHVVLRELDLPRHRRAALADALVGAGACVIAAHEPLPAAVGVHQPASLTYGMRKRPESMQKVSDAGVWGRSCHARAEVERAAEDGADYVTLGPYAETPSKPGYRPTLTAADYAGLPVPTYALGGITPDNAGAARARGCYGVAVMGHVMRSECPGAVVQQLLAAVG